MRSDDTWYTVQSKRLLYGVRESCERRPGYTRDMYAHDGSKREQMAKLEGGLGLMFGDHHSHDTHSNNYFTVATTDSGSNAFPALPPNEIGKSLPNESPTTITMGTDQRPFATDTEEVFE